MDITPLIPKDKKIITGYGDGCFKINGESFEGSLIVCPGEVFAWNVINPTDITTESLTVILEKNIDIELLIIGCGEQHMKLPSDIASAFRTRGISVEIMTTGAACRTYNVLLGEGRVLAAALIAV